MLRPIGPLGISPDHVPAASGDDAMLYTAAVALWLVGVIALVVRKLRSA
jgi:hypothetical protein